MSAVVAAPQEVDASVQAHKEFPQTDSGMSSPAADTEAGRRESVESAAENEDLDTSLDDPEEIPATIALWEEEESGNARMIERLQAAEKGWEEEPVAQDASNSSTDEEEGEEEGVELAAEGATTTATEEETDATDATTAAAAMTTSTPKKSTPTKSKKKDLNKKKSIPRTIAMWGDGAEQPAQTTAPVALSADERFARLKEARLRGVQQKHAAGGDSEDASSMVLQALDNKGFSNGSLAALPSHETTPTRFQEEGGGSKLQFAAYPGASPATYPGSTTDSPTQARLDAEYQYQTAPTQALDLGPSEKTPFLRKEDTSLIEQQDMSTCEQVQENCMVM